MNQIGKAERETQNRVIKLFTEELGYTYLGDWKERFNSNIEEGLLTQFLTESGYTSDQISRAFYLLEKQANQVDQSLYSNNKEVYSLLRYGVPVKTQGSQTTETVHLVDWREPSKNHFAIAEEVTLHGSNERRPDLVLYINGIAFGVLELKRSSVGIGEGIRQALSNQKKEFHEWFYSTIQFVLAGNDSEGLRYGSIATPEKYFLKWKEDEQDNDGYKLDKYLRKLFDKDRVLELMRDFVIFDGGVKKLPRPHQYFGIKLAQEKIKKQEGGIIWHTQGSGKSIVMVLLARWILENRPNARICIITDRDELDKQIRDVFTSAGENIKRAMDSNELMSMLKDPTKRLFCSLVHKFGQRGVNDFDAFIKELESQPTQTVGEVYVFVDECHRTQSGKFNRAMKAFMPSAIFIGFTGTPLLRKDRQTTMEVFGGYIHTYKFSEAVEDEVVLDLVYEARDIDQRLGSQEKIDQWFEIKTKALNNWQKDELKKKWGTMQNVLTSRSRAERVVQDIIFDFSVKPRLSDGRGNAMLVASSIYEACKYFSLFQQTVFKNRCAIITSYDPQVRDITLEDTGANTDTDKEFIFNTYSELLKDVPAQPGRNKTETYEDASKAKFIHEPASMQLLIVVDKLLTGFDSPPCTYLYIDKSMQDHGLFQAICRTNRLDGESKNFGFIVDYKDLFKKVENAISVYSSELDETEGDVSPAVLLQDRLAIGKEKLDNALEALFALCEKVEPPQEELQFIHYFCGNTEIPEDLLEREPQRATFYQLTASLLRAYGNIADEMPQAGYSEERIAAIKSKVEWYVKFRDTIRIAAGETLDVKAYEADMRHLIDTYIQADEPRKISPFDDLPLVELIAKCGIQAGLDRLHGGNIKSQDGIAESIENNIRSKIVKELLTDPEFYGRMSELLDEIITLRKQKAIEYEEYLKRIAEIAKNAQQGAFAGLPSGINTPGKKVLYNNLNSDEALARQLHAAIVQERPDNWRGVPPKEKAMKRILFNILHDHEKVEIIFDLIKKQSEY